MNVPSRNGTATAPPPRSRLLWGGAIFLTGFLSPLLVPLVAATEWPTAWKATLSGLLILGIPELFILVAVAILGKEGFLYLKARLWAFFKRQALPQTVSRARHRVGATLLVLPLLAAWFEPYVRPLTGFVPDWRAALITDLMLLVALFVLGGDFWDKIRMLFVQEARFHLSEPGVSPGTKGRP